MLATSHSLLERLHDRGDTQAWIRLLNVYEPWLRGWLSRHDLQPADAEDVLVMAMALKSENDVLTAELRSDLAEVRKLIAAS